MKEYCVKVSFGFVRSQQTQDTNQHAFPFSYRASPYFLNVYISFLEMFLKKNQQKFYTFKVFLMHAQIICLETVVNMQQMCFVTI